MSEKDLQKLMEAGIIDATTAQNITAFFEQEKKQSSSVLLILFASIGALLLGGGIILILAHNWDRMPEYVRVGVALLPLLLAQIAVWYTLNYKHESLSWREASGTLLFLAIGATIATLGQIYQLPSDLTSFLKIWIIVGLPIMYILKSNTSAFLTLVWIFIFTVNQPSADVKYWHWILLLATIPYYLHSFLSRPHSKINFVFNWLMAILAIVCFILTFDIDQLAFILLAMLTGAYFHLGKNFTHFNIPKPHNSWNTLAHLGVIILTYIFTFEGFWTFYHKELNMPTYFWLLIAVPIVYSLYSSIKNFEKSEFIEPPYHFWLLIILAHFVSIQTDILYIFFNLLLLLYGIYYTNKGIKSNSLYWTNLGLLSIIILITTRFFDINISFLLRGLVFMAMGIGFFFVNYLLLKKGKA